jgi:hypothetical protein
MFMILCCDESRYLEVADYVYLGYILFIKGMLLKYLQEFSPRFRFLEKNAPRSIWRNIVNKHIKIVLVVETQHLEYRRS